jgi:beta-1,2-mannobiose phosphorylase / 1,2-beta-oligomannan phosphorylase
MKSKLLLKPTDVKPSFRDWKVDGVLNPGVVRLANKKILLMVRVAEHSTKREGENPCCPFIISRSEYLNFHDKGYKGTITGVDGKSRYFRNGPCKLPTISHLRKVLLDKSGFKVEKVSARPDFMGIPLGSDYGVEDARIVKLNNEYAMTYVCVSSKNGISSAVATTKNFEKWKRRGIIFQEQNKDVVLFPEKINGKYVALNRPETSFFSRPSIWLSYSPDLVYWGREIKLITTRRNAWDSNRIGAGAPPVKTKFGWLVLYHGVEVNHHSIYSTGGLLLDLKNPSKIIARSSPDKPIIKPIKSYEKRGFMPGVVFTTGAVMDLNGKDLLVFSGGADKVVGVRKIGLKKILDSLESC